MIQVCFFHLNLRSPTKIAKHMSIWTKQIELIIEYLLFFILSNPAVQYSFCEFVGDFLLLLSSRGVFLLVNRPLKAGLLTGSRDAPRVTRVRLITGGLLIGCTPGIERVNTHHFWLIFTLALVFIFYLYHYSPVLFDSHVWLPLKCLCLVCKIICF